MRDFNYVDDVVDAFIVAATNPNAWGRLFNLGSAEVVSLTALADLLVEVNGGGHYQLREFPIDRKKIDIGDYYSDFSLIHQQLGWQPRVTLREGLKRTLDYFREHGSHYL